MTRQCSYTQITRAVQQHDPSMFVHTNNKGCTTIGPVNVRTHKQQGLYNNRTREYSYTQTTKVVQQQDPWILVHTNNKGCTTTRQQGFYDNINSQWSYTQTLYKTGQDKTVYPCPYLLWTRQAQSIYVLIHLWTRYSTHGFIYLWTRQSSHDYPRVNTTNTKNICPNPLVDKTEYSWLYLPMDKTK